MAGLVCGCLGQERLKGEADESARKVEELKLTNQEAMYTVHRERRICVINSSGKAS